MMLAAELQIAGVDVGVVERRTYQKVEGSRASVPAPRAVMIWPDGYVAWVQQR